MIHDARCQSDHSALAEWKALTKKMKVNQCKQASVVTMAGIRSCFQCSNKVWGNPREAVCFSGFVLTRRKTIKPVARYSGRDGWEDTHALAEHTQTLLSTLFRWLVWKDSSGPLSHFKRSCGRRRCLERTFLSHSGVCSSIKRPNPALK